MEPAQQPRKPEKQQEMEDASDYGLRCSRAMEQALAAEDGSDTERAFLLLACELSTKLGKLLGTMELS